MSHKGPVPVGAGNSELRGLFQRSRDWISAALPLWASRGYDAATPAFEEQLTFEQQPVMTAPRRVMVQARQVVVYARAAIEGDYPAGRDLALTAGHAMIRRYLRADGSLGWVFSIDREGRVVDPTRDLYAHAFVLFALAWLRRLQAAPEIDAAIAETLHFLDTEFADEAQGGYWDSLPRKDQLRRQNPHMHLFEALIELYETTGNTEVLARARRLDALATQHFVHSETGALREVFFNNWSVHPGVGQGSLEPGHQMEWAWLWRRFEAQAGEDRGVVVTRLVNGALSSGVDLATGRIIDEIGEDGAIRKATSRSWPHAEAAKALASEIERGRHDLIPIFAAVYRRLLDVYCPTRLDGGWMDHVDEHDGPISKLMPASSLYHLYYGLKSIEGIEAML